MANNMFKNDMAKAQGASILVERKYSNQFASNTIDTSPSVVNDDWNIIRNIQDKLNEQFKGRILEERGKPEFVLELRSAIEKLLSIESHIQTNINRKAKLTGAILDEILGLGPIEPALNDPKVTEIIVVNYEKVYVEKNGKMEIAPEIYFKDDNHVRKVVDSIVGPIGRRIDESSPIVDARLPDGSRVNAIIPPISPNGTTLTIRKFPEHRLTPRDYINFGSTDETQINFIRAAVEARLNIVVSGGTGSGKTTLLNLVSSFIPSHQAIVSIEDSRELKLAQDNWRPLEAKPANNEGKGAITIRDLVKTSLRMRPDRIIVGEVRSGEALDMLQAMNTGHDGSLTTGHANTPKDMISRLETMVLMAGMDLPVRAIREQIASAVDMIIHIARMKDGTRKITHITHVLGIGREGYSKYKKYVLKKGLGDDNTDEDLNESDMSVVEPDKIYLQDIFFFKQTGYDENGKIKGEFLPTGYVPRTLLNKMEAHGIYLPQDMFIKKQ